MVMQTRCICHVALGDLSQCHMTLLIFSYDLGRNETYLHKIEIKLKVIMMPF